MSATSSGLIASGVITLIAYVLLYWAGFQSLDSNYLAFPLQVATVLMLVGSLGLVRSPKSLAPASTPGAHSRGWRLWAPVAVILAPVGFLALSRWAFATVSFEQALPASAKAALWNVLVACAVGTGVVLARSSRPSVAHFTVPVLVFAALLPATFEFAGELRWFQPGARVPVDGPLVTEARALLTTTGAPGARPEPASALIWADPANRDRVSTGAVDVEAIGNSLVPALHTASPISNAYTYPPFGQLPPELVKDAAHSGRLVLLSTNRATIRAAIARVESLAPGTPMALTSTMSEPRLYVAKVASP
jgi:hypothetical protein